MSTAAGPFVDAGAVTPYVPRLLLQRLAERPDVPVEQVEGTVVFVDVSGFTKLSERLARLGRLGAEELTDAIDSCFTGLLALAYANAGSLLKFGGDALLLFFTGDDHVARACRAAIWMRRTLRDIGKLETSGGKVTLRMSVGVHSGSFHFFLVGGSHREFVIAGPAASEAVEMEHTADAGQIVVSPSTAAGLPERLLGPVKGPGRLLRRVPGGRIVEPEEPTVEPDPSVVVSAIPLAIREHLLAGVHDPEHRRATVAFLRYEGFDDLIAMRGAEAAARTLDGLVCDVQSAVDAHDLCFLGSDVDQGGGKLILTAGVPASSGNDEERMLLALRAIADREREIPVRIGVHAGSVFAGDIGPPYRRTYTVMGDAVNLAARLMANARHGAILATDDVLQRSGTVFAVDPVPPFTVKGKAKPVHASSVGPVTGSRARLERSVVPLVDRAEEVAVLRRAAERAALGRGLAVTLTGDAGIGKSRLAAELVAAAGDVRVLRAAGELYRSTIPYAAVRPLLEELLGIDDDSSDRRASLHDAVERVAPALRPWVPLLAVPLDVSVPPTPETEALDERFRRDRLHATVVELLAAATAGPTLFVIEDAQWVDEASLDLVDAVAAAAAQRPWIVCVVSRGGDDRSDDDTYGASGETRVRIDLGPLPRSEIERLLTLLTEDDPMPAHRIRLLAERAGGNPLLARELLGAARAAGRVEGLPDSVEALVTARIDRLAPADRALLRRASVLGTSFSPGLLAELLDDDVTADADIGRLKEFLIVRDDGTITFRHALARDAAYERLPYRQRRQLHERAAASIERTVPDPEDEAELLSLHAFQAKRFDAAWRYARVAAERARAKSAPIEAARFYRRATDAARSLPELPVAEVAAAWEALGDAYDRGGMYGDAARAYGTAYRLVAGDPVREAELLLKQAWIPEREGRYPQAIRRITQGVKALEGIDGAEAGRRRAQLYGWCASVRQAQGKTTEAITWCERAIAEAERAGADDALAHALFIYDWALADLGRFDEATHSPRALEIYEELGDVAGQAAVLNNMGGLAYWQGRWDEAVELYERSRDAREKIGDPVNAAFGTLNIGEIRSDQGRYDEAEEAFRGALRVWRAAETPLGVAYATSFLGRLEARRGRHEEGIELLREAARLFSDAGAATDALETDALIAECLMLQGRSVEAAEVAGAALAIDERTGGQGAQTPLLHRVIGWSELQRGNVAAARAAFERSLEAADVRGAVFDLALGQAALARAASVGGVPEPELERRSERTLRGLGVIAVPEVPLD